MVINDSCAVYAVVTVTQIPVTVKVAAKSQNFHIARFDTWAQSIAFGYKNLPYCVIFCKDSMILSGVITQ